jgi:hypothetical protein
MVAGTVKKAEVRRTVKKMPKVKRRIVRKKTKKATQ